MPQQNFRAAKARVRHCRIGCQCSIETCERCIVLPRIGTREAKIEQRHPILAEQPHRRLAGRNRLGVKPKTARDFTQIALNNTSLRGRLQTASRGQRASQQSARIFQSPVPRRIHASRVQGTRLL
jgi:hypothetical protein